MCDPADPKDYPLALVHALQSQRPDMPMAQVRWAWVEIDAALKTGHPQGGTPAPVPRRDRDRIQHTRALYQPRW